MGRSPRKNIRIVYKRKTRGAQSSLSGSAGTTSKFPNGKRKTSSLRKGEEKRRQRNWRRVKEPASILKARSDRRYGLHDFFFFIFLFSSPSISIDADSVTAKSVAFPGLTTTSSPSTHKSWGELAFNPIVISASRKTDVYREGRKRTKICGYQFREFPKPPLSLLRTPSEKTSDESTCLLSSGSPKVGRYQIDRFDKLRDVAMAQRPSKLGIPFVILGILFLLCSVVTMSWFEWTHTRTAARYWPLLSAMPVACESDPANNGRLVHVDCPVQKLSTFYPRRDFIWNMRRVKGLFFETHVEMYQYVPWPQHCSIGRASRWSSNRDNGWSLLFGDLSRYNPSYWPAVPGQGRAFPTRLQVGEFELHPDVLSMVDSKQSISLTDDGYFSPSPVRPPQKISYYNTQVVDDQWLYSGDPDYPEIGDVRISFYTSTASHLSAIGYQNCNARKCWLEPYGTKEVFLVKEGDYTKNQLVRKAILDEAPPNWYLWTSRAMVFCLATWVSTVIFGLSNPEKWLGGNYDSINAGRAAHFFGILGGGVCSAIFISCSISGALWSTVSLWIGIPILLLGVTGLIGVIIVTATMKPIITEVDGYKQAELFNTRRPRNGDVNVTGSSSSPVDKMETQRVPAVGSAEDSGFFQPL